MRSQNDIVIAAQDQEPATDEELRMALIATSRMLSLTERSLKALADAVLTGRNVEARASFAMPDLERAFRHKKMPLDEYLGPILTPGTPENKANIETARGMYKVATGEEL